MSVSFIVPGSKFSLKAIHFNFSVLCLSLRSLKVKIFTLSLSLGTKEALYS